VLADGVKAEEARDELKSTSTSCQAQPVSGKQAYRLITMHQAAVAYAFKDMTANPYALYTFAPSPVVNLEPLLI